MAGSSHSWHIDFVESRAGMQAGRQAGRQGGREAGRQVGKQACRQAGRRAGGQEEGRPAAALTEGKTYFGVSSPAYPALT